MSRLPRALCTALCLMVVALVFAPRAGRAGPVEQVGDKELARRRFDEGLMFVDRRDYARALAAFQEAYQLQPHPTVLYNIGQAYRALERPREAAATLQRYLDEAPDISPSRRADVGQQIRELKLKIPPPAPEPVPPAAPEITRAALPDRAPPSRLGPALLMGGGAALIGGAVGLRLWNDGRFRSWQSQSDTLAQLAPPQSAREADDIDAQRAASNSRFDQLRRTDNVVWALVAAGAAAAAAGALWWWNNRSPHRPDHTGAAPGRSVW